MAHILTPLVILALFSLAHSERSPPPEVFCLDKFSDLSTGQWNHDSPEPTLHYAKTSQDLPDLFKGKLSGKDLFYFDGQDQATFWLVSVENWADGTPTPIYMYLKYYSYIGAQGGQEGTFVVPKQGSTDNSNHRYQLPPTNDYEWREELIELSSTSSAAFQLYLNYYSANDYFIMDTVILSKGHPIGGVGDIRRLCGEVNENVCQGEEFYPDPSSCSQFHQCQYNEDGSVLDDSVFTCPDTTVWCQQGKQCDYPSRCPCSN